MKVGDLVVPMVRRPCAHDACLACTARRQDFCYTGDYTERGIKERHGFMTEWVIDDERYMNVVPRALRDVGVLVEPLTIAEKTLAQIAQIQQRLPWACAATGDSCHRAVVLGAGPVGLLGASTLAFEVLAALGTNGIFVFTGVPARRAPITIDTDLSMRNLVLKNQVVLGSVNASRPDFEAAIGDLALFRESWPRTLAALVTGHFPIDAYAGQLLDAPAEAIKNVIALS